MDAMHPITVKISSQIDAGGIFQSYLDAPVLAPLCKEAEADVPKGTPHRSLVLIEKVVNKVYQAARPWKVSVPKEFSYGKLEFDELVATQKANHVYHNLLQYFKGTSKGQEFASSKFPTEFEMYSFLEKETSIEIKRWRSGEIAHWEILKSLTRYEARSLGFQNCGYEYIPTEVNNNQQLKHLDMSYNKIREIEGYFNFVPKLTSLNLSYNLFEQAPSKLPSGLSELRLRGNPIKTLKAFDGLENLSLLDISYMPSDFTIDRSFWQKAGFFKIVISPDMQQIKVPHEARAQFVSCHNESEVFPIDAFGFVKTKFPIPKSPELVSSPSQDFVRMTTSKKRKGLPPVIKWLGIGALIGVFAFIMSKFWRHAHR